MDTWVIYVRSKTLESDKEAVHIWKKDNTKTEFLKNPTTQAKTPELYGMQDSVLLKSCLYGDIWKVLV